MECPTCNGELLFIETAENTHAVVRSEGDTYFCDPDYLLVEATAPPEIICGSCGYKPENPKVQWAW
jgi:hypothetical protein